MLLAELVNYLSLRTFYTFCFCSLSVFYLCTWYLSPKNAFQWNSRGIIVLLWFLVEDWLQYSYQV